MSARVLIIGHPGETHLGGHLMRAAAALGVDATLVDSAEAYGGSAWRRRANWWLRGHRPARLEAFTRTVVAAARDTAPDVVLATGIAPIAADGLRAIAATGVRLVDYLTDDPWNPAHRASWFFAALRTYDHVFTPRRSNLGDLEALGGPEVSYLPFGYDPDIHRPPSSLTDDDRRTYDADVMFAGGADRERVATVQPLIAAGLHVALYGGYWDRDPATRASARGFLDADGIRRAVAVARLCLCLVRRANRDGHAMRSFEVPAIGGCPLVEDTPEHRAIFGPDGDAAVYFDSPETMLREARALLAAPERRRQLAEAAHSRITQGGHTYRDRLAAILETVERARASRAALSQ
ncbi:MAG TPA: glycosyltransferase [Vicinamibacterales bacterium]|nr:glycosyltransferase [Vicinamibacterales bacterium]